MDICEEHGKKYKTITRRFKTEGEKREHVYKLNLARRHLNARDWGSAFKKWMSICDVRDKPGRPSSDDNSVTFTQLCEEAGVNPETAKKRVKLADQYDALPKKEKAAIDAGEKTLKQAVNGRAPGNGTNTVS